MGIQKIIVMNRKSATEWCFGSHDITSAIISITDVSSKKALLYKSDSNNVKRIMWLNFNDEEIDAYSCISCVQADQIVHFALTLNDIDMLIVHCDAGISRSAGVAAALSKFFFNDDSMFFDPRSKYIPNMTCYRRVLNAVAVLS